MSNNNELLQYRREVPEEVRERIKQQLLEASIEGYDEFIQVSAYIVAQLVGGEISPGIAKEARSYLELIMTAITAKQITNKGKEATAVNVSKDLEKARKKAKKLRPNLELTDYGNTQELSIKVKEKERA